MACRRPFSSPQRGLLHQSGAARKPCSSDGAYCGRRLLRTLSPALLYHSRPARARHADRDRCADRTVGVCDAVHSLRSGSRDMREPGFRAPDHAGGEAIAGAFSGEPILRRAGSRAQDRTRAVRPLGLKPQPWSHQFGAAEQVGLEVSPSSRALWHPGLCQLMCQPPYVPALIDPSPGGGYRRAALTE
jgi:hypothetical protein